LHEDGRTSKHDESNDLHEFHTIVHSTTESLGDLLLFLLFDFKRYDGSFSSHFLALALPIDNSRFLVNLSGAISLVILLGSNCFIGVFLVNVSNPSAGDHRHQAVTDNHCCSQFKNDEDPVQDLSTEYSTRAHFTELDGRESVSMVRSVEVLLHREEHEQHLEGEGSTWSRIVSACDNSSEAIELQK
jgi:hypothetical protein